MWPPKPGIHSRTVRCGLCPVCSPSTCSFLPSAAIIKQMQISGMNGLTINLLNAVNFFFFPPVDFAVQKMRSIPSSARSKRCTFLGWLFARRFDHLGRLGGWKPSSVQHAYKKASGGKTYFRTRRMQRQRTWGKEVNAVFADLIVLSLTASLSFPRTKRMK